MIFRDILLLLASVPAALARLLGSTLATLLPWAVYENYRQEQARLEASRAELVKAVSRLELARGQEVLPWVDAISVHLAQATRGRRFSLQLRYALFVLGSALPVVIAAGWLVPAILIGVGIAIIVALQNYPWNDGWRWHLLRARQYEVELRRYLALSGKGYAGKTHAQGYVNFQRRMAALDEQFSALVYEVENWPAPPMR
jgi:hypothetical protein